MSNFYLSSQLILRYREHLFAKGVVKSGEDGGVDFLDRIFEYLGRRGDYVICERLELVLELRVKYLYDPAALLWYFGVVLFIG